jgi:P27 family predicted phage terminase small subunit
MAGRLPKPSALKRQQGTDRADRRNGQEPEPDLLLELSPPAHLAPDSAAVWAQVAPMLHRAKVLTVADTIALEMLCDAVADYRKTRQERGDDFVQHSAKGSQMLNQLHVAMAMSSKRAEAFMAKFGMDPVSRSRVMVDPQGDLFGKPDQAANNTGRFFPH